MIREQWDALKRLAGETAEPTDLELPGSKGLVIRHATTIVRLRNSPWWCMQISVVNTATNVGQAFTPKTLLNWAAYIMRDAGHYDGGQWWHYDRALHVGQLLVPLHADEVEQLTTEPDDTPDMVRGTYASERYFPATMN